jgi:hypothetical protein
MVFNATFNNISVILWQSVLLLHVNDIDKIMIHKFQERRHQAQKFQIFLI